MEQFNKTITYRFNKDLNKDEIQDLQERLKKVEGILSLEISSALIRIEYDTLCLAAKYIKEEMNNLGYPVKEIREKRRGILSRFIKNLADTNRKIYGNKKLDCCDLNHD
ncbi:MAG: hypothetical protein JXB19_07350 [Bacteroidales bacterium]|nr:hypothetical protein [Bacteroidales bacterium]